MNSPARSAVTLLEIIVAVAILSSILTVALEGLASGTRLSGTMESAMVADSAVNDVMAEITREMRSATDDDSDFAVDPLTFRVCSGFDMDPASPEFGQAEYDDLRSYVFDAAAGTLTKVYNPGEADSWSKVVAYNVTDFRVHGDANVYFIEMTTSYTDSDGIVCTRTAEGRIFLRSGLIDPEAYGAAIGGTTAGDPGGEPPSPNPDQVNNPTLEMTLNRSFNGKDVTGTIVATVPSGDSVTDLVLEVDSGGWSPNITTSSTTTSIVKTIQLTGVKNIEVTVIATATSGSGGSTVQKQVVAP